MGPEITDNNSAKPIFMGAVVKYARDQRLLNGACRDDSDLRLALQLCQRVLDNPEDVLLWPTSQMAVLIISFFSCFRLTIR